MAAINQPSMTYHGQEFRVRVEITRAQALASPDYPADLVRRARAKMESLQSEGKIAFFDVFENKLVEIWELLRNAKEEPPTLAITFTLAAGAPQMPGLTIEKGPSDKTALIVTISPEASRKTWIKECIRATIVHKAREFGIVDPLSLAQVQACITRILSGDPITGYSIPLMKAFPPPNVAGKPYSIIANKARGEIAVIINDLKTLQQPKNMDALNQVILQTVEKLKQQAPGQYRFHRQDFINCVAAAWKGPERLGIGLPMTVLTVTGQLSVGGSNAVTKHLEFKIAPNRMTAQISGFKPELYTHATFKFTREALLDEMRLSGITYGLTDEIWADLEAAWNSHESLEGFKVAEGTEPIPGVDPFVYLSYKDAPENSKTSDVIDIREAQQRSLVQAGQLVAETRYKNPPVPGKTVTGQVIHAPLPAFDIKLGDGIAQREPGRYYATEDGIPIFEDSVLMVNKTFVHPGDVDLKSGNIRFDGPVEIKGSIDTGAVVDVIGPLTVLGTIRGGMVYSKNGITVKQGIVTTDKGFVKCQGDIKAEFIENSHIECSGNLLVNKAILNSQIFAGRTIQVVSNEGVVGGGLISCSHALVSQNVGFPSGAKTVLIIGADARSLRRVTLCKNRVEKLKAAFERYKLEQRELQSKREIQMTAKHKERKQKLAALVNKARALGERAEKAVIVAQSKIVYNPTSLIAVYNRLSTNCSIEVGGTAITMASESLGVAILAKPRRGEHFCPVEDAKADIERHLGRSDSPAPKKAG